MTCLAQSTPNDAQVHQLVWTQQPADCFTPVRAYLSLRAAGHRPCLLESAPGAQRLTRYSMIGVRSSASFRAAHDGATLSAQGQTEPLEANGLDALREVMARFKLPEPPVDFPPFCGGWIGGFSYAWAGVLEPRTKLGTTQLDKDPYARFELFEEVIVFDHAARKMWLIKSCRTGEAGYEQGQADLAQLYRDIAREPAQLSPFEIVSDAPEPNMAPSAFQQGVQKLQDLIRNGELFQAVLSQRFDQRFIGDPFFVYRALSLANPSPHMFYYESEGLTLIGSSPERLVCVRGNSAETLPIAGTRPRGATPSEDEALGKALCADEKERAEHDMLVDLARNDLGRVAKVGSVQLDEYAGLEKFKSVQHLVSRVSCALDPEKDALDALAACFPAGTVSGAPKIRAMTRVAEIEADSRGFYAGCFGYVDHRGQLDMTLNIRTICVTQDRLSVQAGAGVVLDSDPELEYQETRHKARALFEAIALAGRPSLYQEGPLR